jgi:hypothetical protein
LTPLIHNAVLQTEIDQTGFIKGPSLSAPLIEALLQAYLKLKTSNGRGSFFTTTMSNDMAYRRAANQAIVNILQPVLDETFQNFRVVYGNFMVKPPGADTECNLHQDWTYVDEEKYCTLNIWIPLVDTNSENGSIHLAPGSHQFDKRIRGRNIWWPYYDARDAIIKTLMKPVPLNAGESVIFNSKTFHYSPTNCSGQERVAVSVVVAPIEAKLLHYYAKAGNIYKAPITDTSYYVDYGVYAEDFAANLEPELFSSESEYRKVLNPDILNLQTAKNY